MLLALLSPAKRLDFSPAPDFAKASAPALMDDAALVAARAKKLTRGQIAKLMDISPKLAELNFERFQQFDPKNGGTTKAAIYAFAGDVYMGFDAKTMTEKDLAFAQKHIGIISGLYGLLRPLDAIQPYRLEMGSSLKNDRGKDLYAFWRESLTAHVNDRTDKATTIINLASQEYWGAINEKELTAPVIHCHFKEIKKGKASIVAFFAKKARGMMARYIVENRLTKPEQIKAFDTAGYTFDAKASDATQWVFSRPAVPPMS